MAIINWTNGKANIPTPGNRGNFNPYPYQNDAWKEMDKYFKQQDKSAGIIWIPTGGGKTVVAVKWLYDNVLSKSNTRVLWIAHRQSLLKQATETFDRLFDIKKNSEEKGIDVALVAGGYSHWHNILATDRIVFTTIQSAYSNENSLKLMADQSSGGLYVVVDECHHAQAPSNRRILQSLKDKNATIIGLTATPFCIDDKKTNMLWKFFDSPDKIPVTRVYKKYLIDHEFLAKPILQTIKTNIEQKDIVEDGETITKNSTKDSELKSYVLKRLAQNPARNKLLAQHYAKNKEIYQKTIIFTPETMANKYLAAELKKLNIDADYIDTTRPSKENETIMDRFRREDSFQVLVNTEMCTEGFDAPKTKTVFIARPTQSETLVQQMVGRAMRGWQAGGNKECYLVTFVDTWKDFEPIDPQIVVNTEEADSPEVLTISGGRIPIPDYIIDECYHLLLKMQYGELSNSFDGIPYGWYEWDAPENSELEDVPDKRRILIFANQVDGYDALEKAIRDGELKLDSTISDGIVEGVKNKFFDVCVDPVPQSSNIKILLQAWSDGGIDSVSRTTFVERERFNTRKIANDIISEDLSDSKQEKLIDSLWEDRVCRRLFATREHFSEDIDRQKRLIRDKNKTVEAIQRIPPEKRIHTILKWNEGETGYNLRAIANRIGSMQQLFPRSIPSVKEIDYRERLDGAFGICQYTDGNKIVILEKLNSPSVPLAVMEFLVYHEMLHADGYHRHDAKFRELERKFFPSQEAIANAVKYREIYPEWNTALNSKPVLWQALCDQFLQLFYLHFKENTEIGEY